MWPRGGVVEKHSSFIHTQTHNNIQIEGGSIILRKKKGKKKKEEKRWKKEKGKKKEEEKKKSFIWQHKREQSRLCVLCVIYVIHIFPHNSSSLLWKMFQRGCNICFCEQILKPFSFFFTIYPLQIYHPPPQKNQNRPWPSPILFHPYLVNTTPPLQYLTTPTIIHIIQQGWPIQRKIEEK